MGPLDKAQEPEIATMSAWLTGWCEEAPGPWTGADSSSKIPLGVTIEAYGNNGFTFTPRGSGGPGVNTVTIMNVPKR
ncbi:DUF305 domain-containing protein [Streptomyces sp. NK15101]|uniref:DUF305 domain-containing protein n=1 Tax=Streptomyces sp. NK15101 TaxID=2873261 RepID=UPI001CECC1AF|nr:DUF305 domain-containing protein [Streptomyces sp. NK15101]